MSVEDKLGAGLYTAAEAAMYVDDDGLAETWTPMSSGALDQRQYICRQV